MSKQLETLEAEALQLTAEERVLLADRLLASLSEDGDYEDAWATEVKRRIAEIESGRVTLAPAAEAITRAREALNLSVDPEAEYELIDGAIYYANQSHRELGLAFIAEFERSLEVLRMRPLLGAVWRENTRRFALRRFPYSIIYQVTDETLRVIALAHQRRKPGYWVGRK